MNHQINSSSITFEFVAKDTLLERENKDHHFSYNYLVLFLSILFSCIPFINLVSNFQMLFDYSPIYGQYNKE